MKHSILILSVLMTACASNQPEVAKAPDCTDTVTIQKVPVIQPWPTPPVLKRPAMPSLNIPPMAIKNKDYAVINNYLEADVGTLYGYIEVLEKALKPYYTPPALPK